MNLHGVAHAAYQSTRNLYVCGECQIVRLISDDMLKSVEVETTAKLTGMPAYLEITIKCPVCKEATRHFHLLESNLPGSAQQQAISGIAQGIGSALIKAITK